MTGRDFPRYQQQYDKAPAAVGDELVSAMQSRSNLFSRLEQAQKTGQLELAANLEAQRQAAYDRVIAARDALAAYGYGPWEPITP
jgi:hypothetical protein